MTIRKHKKYYIFKAEDGTRLYGANAVIKKYKDEVDFDEIAIKTAKKRGVDPDELKAQWKKAGEVSMARGKKYHEMMETKYAALKRSNIFLPKEGQLVWKEQELEKDSVYIEKMVWSVEHEVMGFVDYIQTVGNNINIIDYKTSNKIERENPWQSYNEPIKHLDDCKFVDYSLQLNLYMALLLEANPKFKMGKMIIEHVKFDDNDSVIGVEKMEALNLQKEINNIWK